MYSIGEFAKLIGVSNQTLIRWDHSGKLKPVVLESGHRRYTDDHLREIKGIKENRINVIYCRESTRQQKSSLERQEEKLKEFCCSAGIHIDHVISDFGSGLNYNRKGLQQLITLICTGSVDTLVIFYKDRLMRFGYEMFEFLCKEKGVKIIVVDQTESNKSQQEEFAEDLVAIVHYFSMRLYGSRSYKKKLKEYENSQS
jgi:predicted site-specific integrase-resolvase